MTESVGRANQQARRGSGFAVARAHRSPVVAITGTREHDPGVDR